MEAVTSEKEQKARRIEVILEQVPHVTRQEAEDALAKADGEVTTAIMQLGGFPELRDAAIWNKAKDQVIGFRQGFPEHRVPQITNNESAESRTIRHVDIILEHVPDATRAEAENALQKANGDVIKAIMELDLHDLPELNTVNDEATKAMAEMPAPFRYYIPFANGYRITKEESQEFQRREELEASSSVDAIITQLPGISRSNAAYALETTQGDVGAALLLLLERKEQHITSIIDQVAGATRADAKEALEATRGDIVHAIMLLEDQREAKCLKAWGIAPRDFNYVRKHFATFEASREEILYAFNTMKGSVAGAFVMLQNAIKAKNDAKEPVIVHNFDRFLTQVDYLANLGILSMKNKKSIHFRISQYMQRNGIRPGKTCYTTMDV